MSVTRYEVEIDLSQVEQAKLQNNKQYFHQDIYAGLVSQVSSQMEKSDHLKTCNQRDDINETRSHDAILLNGERGCGKTSILVNFSNYMRKDPAAGSAHSKILFLNPVDPTLLNEKEDFLNIVLGQINANEEVCRARDNARHEHADIYEKTLEQLAEAMEGEQTLKERYGLDRMLSYQGGLEITKYAHTFFREVLRLTEKSLIVLPIDDVDMSLEHGFKVLEVVRKYLCSPHFLSIVSGDLNLYRELVVNSFSRALVETTRDNDSKNALRSQAAELATEYLRKVFPIHNRHTVPAIDGYLNGRAVDGKILTAIVRQNANDVLIDLASLGHLIHAAVNGRVNGEEQSSIEIVIPTARQLIQFLKSLEEVLSNMQTNTGQQKKANQMVFQSRLEAIKWWQRQDKQTATAFYLALEKYFKHTQNQRLQYLCAALAGLNQPADQVAIELNKLTYLSLVRQTQMELSNQSPRQNETYGLYSSDEPHDWIAAQFERLPPVLKDKEIRTLTPLPAIEPIDRKLKFTRKWKAAGADDQFLHDLLTHSDFYTSYQTAPLVFFGKFFELITTSLMRDIDGKWLQNLLNRPPYYSIFEASGTKTFELEDDDTPPDIDDDSNQAVASLLSRARLDQIAESINKFRSKEQLGVSAFVDMAMIHALQSKFFNQMNLFKRAGYITVGRKGLRKDIPESQLLSALASRAMYTYWTALGSFELGELYFASQPKIAHHNFASANQIALGNLNSNQAYLLNVKPFLDLKENTDWPHSPVTKLLAAHPVFKMITAYQKATVAAPQATTVATSGFTATATATPLRALPHNNMRRPNNYKALSVLVSKHFSSDAFDRCVVEISKHQFDAVYKFAHRSMAKLNGLALAACQQNQAAANTLLRKLGTCLREKQFFDQRIELDQLLLIISMVAIAQGVNTEDHAAMLTLLQKFGTSKLTTTKIGLGI